MGSKIVSYFGKNKTAVFLVLLQLIGFSLITFLGLRVSRVRTEAYALITNPPTDTCNIIEVSVSEPTSCPKITSGGKNQVSSYKALYTLKNVTGAAHTVRVTKRSDYCTEPFGQSQPIFGQPGCWSNTNSNTDNINLVPGQSIDIPIERSSLSGQACGSFQTDIFIAAVDGNTACHSRNGQGTANAATVCQTGIVCTNPTLTPTPTATPTPSITPTPTLTPSVTPTPTSTTTPIPGPTQTPQPPSSGGGGNPGAPAGCTAGDRIVWAPTIILQQRDAQDPHTLHLKWTTVRDGLHTYWLEWGTDGVNWPWKQVVQGESTDLHNLPSSTIWTRVAGYDCVIGPFSGQQPQVLGTQTPPQLPKTGASFVGLLLVVLGMSGTGFYLFRRFQI